MLERSEKVQGFLSGEVVLGAISIHHESLAAESVKPLKACNDESIRGFTSRLKHSLFFTHTLLQIEELRGINTCSQTVILFPKELIAYATWQYNFRLLCMRRFNLGGLTIPGPGKGPSSERKEAERNQRYDANDLTRF